MKKPEKKKEIITNNISFIDEVFSFDYPKEILQGFYDYWSEPIKTGKFRKDMQKNWCTAKRLKSWARHFEVEREGAGTAEQEEASFTFDMEENEKLQLSSNNKPKNYILRLISIKTKKEALITILSFAVLIAVLVFPQTIPYYFILIFILIIGMRIYDIYQTIKQYKKTNKQERSSLLNDAKNSAVNEITFWS